MKKYFYASTISIFLIACASTNDSVHEAKEKTDTVNHSMNDAGSRFIIEMTDARLMDLKEGSLASKRGTSKKIRKYGKLMIDDQTKLLGELKNLGMSENVVLPEVVSDEKKAAFEDLSKSKGRKFDKKFISMMKIDHERDIKQFTDISGNNNVSLKTREFAIENLPLIKSHLEKLEKLH